MTRVIDYLCLASKTDKSFRATLHRGGEAQKRVLHYSCLWVIAARTVLALRAVLERNTAGAPVPRRGYPRRGGVRPGSRALG